MLNKELIAIIDYIAAYLSEELDRGAHTDVVICKETLRMALSAYLGGAR